MIPSGRKDRLFYGWVVGATFFIAGTAIWGIRYTFGVFFKSIEGEFGLTRAATSSIFSAQMVLGMVFTIVGGWALDKYGPKLILFLMGLFTGLGLVLTGQTGALWQLFLTYSLFLAMGTSIIFVVVMTTVSRWFDRRRGLALGVASCGAGLGPVVTAPLATYLIGEFNWHTAFVIIGLITWLVVVPLSRLSKRDPYEIGALLDGAKVPSEYAGHKRVPTAGLSLS
ncbi:MAG: MFS transporter [Dehalococcoidales bacterium]|jgi:MFS family permease|nr:MFS transporter [Dehalococcoidales bacterium]